jgi:anti-sigma regulatory factor (Ser/Thr protein kinase)
MTFLHDPNRRAVPPDTRSYGRTLPRQRAAVPYADDGRNERDGRDGRDGREEPERLMRIDAVADAGTGTGTQPAGSGGFVCSDCDLGFGQHVHLHLRPAAAEVGRARATVGKALTSWGCPSEAVDDSRLLVSELLANAITHAPGTWITLDLMLIGDRLLLEVTDGSLAQPVVRQADLQEEQGRGMFLVEAVASAWGARRGRRGRKTTWCTLAIDGRGEIRPSR